MTKTLQIRALLALLALLVASHAQAWSCKYERDIDVTVDLGGSDKLEIIAMAGELEVFGQPGIREARAFGKVCASKADWLEEATIDTQTGRTARIEVALPDTDGGWSIMGNDYVYIDLRVEVPDNVALDVQDSSGDVDIDGTGSLDLKDSSGDIDIRNVRGDVWLSDSSGQIDVVDIFGNVTVRQDSSGDISGRNIEGSVTVERDSSGDISFRNVRDDYVVERDSSGDIEAELVGGDFRVLRDGSGDIDLHGISGQVDIPDKS